MIRRRPCHWRTSAFARAADWESVTDLRRSEVGRLERRGGKNGPTVVLVTEANQPRRSETRVERRADACLLTRPQPPRNIDPEQAVEHRQSQPYAAHRTAHVPDARAV